MADVCVVVVVMMMNQIEFVISFYFWPPKSHRPEANKRAPGKLEAHEGRFAGLLQLAGVMTATCNLTSLASNQCGHR